MKWVLLTTTFLVITSWTESKLDPYKVLNVKRSSTTQDIRKQYKNLAKEWHPDKNDSPDAQEKFVQINAAYEILSDPEKRQRYDDHGIVNDQPHQGSRGNHDPFRQHFRRFHSGGFGFDGFFESEFFGSGPFGGGGSNRADPGLYQKQSITAHQYYNTIVPDSHQKPFLIMFYSDWCFTCLRVEPIWAKLTEELEPVGFGIVTVHAGKERELARKIGSNELPHIGLLMDGKIVHYKDPQFSALRVLEFVRNKLPWKLVETIDDGNVDSFLKGWSDNRIRVLLFGKTDVIRLRYLTTAFKYRSRAKLGYVRIGNLLTKKTTSKYNIAKNSDSMLIFHEDSEHPVAFVSMQDLSLSTLFEVIESHKFLTLPRLSSQNVMDQLCPSESSKTKKKLCVILLNNGKNVHEFPEEEAKRTHLRSFVLHHTEFSPDRVRFVYLLKDIQTDFANALVTPQDKQDLNLAIVWRKETNKLKYEWFQSTWSSEQSNKSQEELKMTLDKLLSPNEILSHETVLNELLDEHAASLPMRLINRMLDTWDFLKDNLSKDEVLPVISLIAALAFVFIGAQCLQSLVPDDDENSDLRRGQSGNPASATPELKLVEFKAETYNGLVRLQRPGCRTMILICDIQSKNQLVSKFFKIMWPYRRNKTLNFGYMFIEKGMSWYKDLLEQTTESDIASDRQINAKNCVGTVLALNGHRKYFCMYHARHPEGARSTLQMQQRNAAGSFMGFDESDSDSDQDPEVQLRRRLIRNEEEKNKSLENRLLDGLPLWLDRLFEGSTQRYYLNYWPDLPVYGNQSRHMHND